MKDEPMAALYKQYAQSLYRYLYSLCGNHHDAEDLTAETFYRAVRAAGRYDGGQNVQAWLFQIARRLWVDFCRRKKAVPGGEWLEELACGGDLAADTEHRLERLELYRRIQALDAPTRDVMHLRLSGELSFAEIGEILGKSENWARVIFYRGKERMKHETK